MKTLQKLLPLKKIRRPVTIPTKNYFDALSQEEDYEEEDCNNKMETDLEQDNTQISQEKNRIQDINKKKTTSPTENPKPKKSLLKER